MKHCLFHTLSKPPIVRKFSGAATEMNLEALSSAFDVGKCTLLTGTSVSSYQSCLDNGGADNTCQSLNAVCKNDCSGSYKTCLESGGDTSGCLGSYSTCLDAFKIFTTPANSAGIDCVSTFNECHVSGTADNTCNAGTWS